MSEWRRREDYLNMTRLRRKLMILEMFVFHHSRFQLLCLCTARLILTSTTITFLDIHQQSNVLPTRVISKKRLLDPPALCLSPPLSHDPVQLLFRFLPSPSNPFKSFHKYLLRVMISQAADELLNSLSFIQFDTFSHSPFSICNVIFNRRGPLSLDADGLTDCFGLSLVSVQSVQLGGAGEIVEMSGIQGLGFLFPIILHAFVSCGCFRQCPHCSVSSRFWNEVSRRPNMVGSTVAF